MNPSTNNIRNKSIIKLVLTVVILLILLVTAMFLWDYFITQKVITLNPSPNTSIAIYNQKPNQLITKVSGFKKISLRPEAYNVKFTGSTDFQEESETLLVNKPITITTPSLNYTRTKLNQLLNSESVVVHAVLMASMPNNEYKINNEIMLGTGNWYCAQLIPKDWYDPTVPADYIPRPVNINNTMDILKVILKKEDGTWKPAAGPSIVFSIGDFPSIPQKIISTANHLGFN